MYDTEVGHSAQKNGGDERALSYRDILQSSTGAPHLDFGALLS
jgi:hypothetical protein